MILDALHAKEAIAAALHLAVREKSFVDPDDAARAFGIRPLGDKWRRVDRDTASRVLLALLIEDMAFSSPRVSGDQAEAATEEFLSRFDSEAAFFTNGTGKIGWRKQMVLEFPSDLSGSRRLRRRSTAAF